MVVFSVLCRSVESSCLISLDLSASLWTPTSSATPATWAECVAPTVSPHTPHTEQGGSFSAGPTYTAFNWHMHIFCGQGYLLLSCKAFPISSPSYVFDLSLFPTPAHASPKKRMQTDTEKKKNRLICIQTWGHTFQVHSLQLQGSASPWWSESAPTQACWHNLCVNCSLITVNITKLLGSMKHHAELLFIFSRLL